MKNKEQFLNVLIVAMSLATAWAIRGQFGHEQGAAWAGAIGGLALILVSKRKDWYQKMILVALASAVGWGAGGMISYGIVVGYGKADNFINAFYGLSMLFVIGALFGLLGGGLVGLVLQSTRINKVKWGSLFAEMVAGGLISYYFLVEQIGFKMTPPRSEAWAIILGAGLVMLWHMAREKQNAAIRVAIFSALGAGFGFAFGNFLQILGNVLEVQFNMWNVMEYSIGFFGGGAMAYGVFSSKWPEEDVKTENWLNKSSLFIIAIIIPLIVFRETLSYSRFVKYLTAYSNTDNLALYSTTMVAIVLFTMMILLFLRLKKDEYQKKDIAFFFFLYFLVYTFLSYMTKGLAVGHMEINHHLYLVNIGLIYLLIKRDKTAVFYRLTDRVTIKKWFIYFLTIIIFIALLSIIAINIHDEMGGAHDRFQLK